MKVKPLSVFELNSDHLILTPNRRLSAWLARDYDKSMLNSGRVAWPQLHAVPIESWFVQQFESHSAANPTSVPTLLSRDQSRILWHQTLLQSDIPIHDAEGMVALCQQAHSLVHRWRLPESCWQIQNTPEQVFFYEAQRQYRLALEANNWLDMDLLPQWLVQYAKPDISQSVAYLHGFIDLHEPQLIAVKNWLSASKVGVEFSSQLSQPRADSQQRESYSSGYLTFDNRKNEFRSAIAWAVERHIQNPEKRYGVVVPNLQQESDGVRALCDDFFAVNEIAEVSSWHSLINITAGKALAGYGLASHLLLLLSSLHSTLSLDQWAVILKSPYLCANETTFLEHDRFVQYLKQKNRNQLRIKDLVHLWTQGFNSSVQCLLQPLLGELPSSKQQPVKYWITWLDQTLQRLNWAGFRVLSSVEFQIQERVHQVTSELVDVQLLMGDISFSHFRQELESRLRATRFQPQTDTAPIQIMGVLESSGINFDGIWLCESESTNWPAANQANPLLPRSVLREYKMPGSGPEREQHYAAQLLEGYCTAAPEIVFSWCQYQGDAENTLSPMLGHIQELKSFETAFILQSREMAQSEQLGALIEFCDDDVVGQPLLHSQLKGGSGIIKSQSQCPFKAYAEYRLNIRSTDEIQEGVKANDRGTLVHRVLEAFWKQVKNQQQLVKILQDSDHLDSLINQILEDEMIRFKTEVHLFPKALYELERQRTFQLVQDWVRSCEAIRAPFEVMETEQNRKLIVGGLELSLTVDRIDQLEDGSRIVIDYKTGLKTASSWLGARPEEPQLPLYVFLEPENTSGVYFGVLHSDKRSWYGLEQENTPFVGKRSRTINSPKEGWQDQLDQWKQALENLAAEIEDGVARVEPSRPLECGYCHLSPVCRIKERTHDIS